MKRISLRRLITKPYYQTFQVEKGGLVALLISARCKSKRQIGDKFDENLRVEIDSLQCKEIVPDKKIQLFDIPPSFNGSDLKGLKKTVIFLIVLSRGEHIINFIPRPSAFLEELSIIELSGQNQITLPIEDQAEDGNWRSWYAISVINLPVSYFSLEAAVSRRKWDSDDLRIVIDGRQKALIKSSLLKWLLGQRIQRVTKTIFLFLDIGMHYIDIVADRMPFLYALTFHLIHKETKSEIRAASLVRFYAQTIKLAAKEFKIDSVMVAAVIYQEQAQNVNFLDYLVDYIGGVFHLNTSVGIGQVRIKTAKDLEKIYPQLKSQSEDYALINYDAVVTARLSEPLTNMRYVAAKVKFSQERWAKANYDISNKPEILGTLYNIEEISSPIIPHEFSEPNQFGLGVKENYEKVRQLLE